MMQHNGGLMDSPYNVGSPNVSSNLNANLKTLYLALSDLLAVSVKGKYDIHICLTQLIGPLMEFKNRYYQMLQIMNSLPKQAPMNNAPQMMSPGYPFNSHYPDNRSINRKF